MGQGVIPYLVLELCPWINTPLSWPVCLLDDVQCVCVCVPELCSQTAGEPNDRCDANYLDQQIGVQRERELRDARLFLFPPSLALTTPGGEAGFAWWWWWWWCRHCCWLYSPV